MTDFLLAPENFPFATALVLMLLIGAVEAFGFGFAAIDTHADLDAPDAELSPLLDWLGFGRLPLLMVLVIGLASFGLAGIALQQIALGTLGHMFSAWTAGAAAAVAALPLTGLLSRPVARIFPSDETTAVSLDSLVGRRGFITLGTAIAGSPARARVRDAFGQSHYVLVEPNLPDGSLVEGDEILLVAREADRFRAVAVAPHITLEQGDRP